MLLAINWHYWQVGKNSCMHMKVQGHLMQARFTEIHQVFAKKKKVGYFSNRVVYIYYLMFIKYKNWLISVQLQSLMDFEQNSPNETVLQEYGIPVEMISAEIPFRLEGCISSCAHGQGRSATDRQFFYVNSRPCEPAKVRTFFNTILYVHEKLVFRITTW